MCAVPVHGNEQRNYAWGIYAGVVRGGSGAACACACGMWMGPGLRGGLGNRWCRARRVRRLEARGKRRIARRARTPPVDRIKCPHACIRRSGKKSPCMSIHTVPYTQHYHLRMDPAVAFGARARAWAYVKGGNGKARVCSEGESVSIEGRGRGLLEQGQWARAAWASTRVEGEMVRVPSVVRGQHKAVTSHWLPAFEARRWSNHGRSAFGPVQVQTNLNRFTYSKYLFIWTLNSSGPQVQFRVNGEPWTGPQVWFRGVQARATVQDRTVASLDRHTCVCSLSHHLCHSGWRNCQLRRLIQVCTGLHAPGENFSISLAPISSRHQEIMLNTSACGEVLPTQHKMEVLAWHARDGADCGPRAD
jgi:hypothetical protein